MIVQAPRVYPVIHFLDSDTTLAEVEVARTCGADGVFLISHALPDRMMLDAAGRAIRRNEGFPIGINLLSMSCFDACVKALEIGSPMVWADRAGVSSSGVTEDGARVADVLASNPGLQVFAGVAFKYQPTETDPVAAANETRRLGFIPTTSGTGTGKAADLGKIKSMGAGGQLAIASGITPENVRDYAPYLSHILVATGVSRTEFHIAPPKLLSLIDSLQSQRHGPQRLL